MKNNIKFHWMHRFNWPNSKEGLVSMVKDLEAIGVDSVLLPYGSTGPDYLVHADGMMSATRKIKLMVALRPYSLTPEYAAKTFKALSGMHKDRLTLNVVAGALSPEEEEYTFKYYPGDVGIIDTIDKRIELAENWTKLFMDIMGEHKPTMYTIANSPNTLVFGNKYFDHVIFNSNRLEYNSNNFGKAKHILVIDPQIIENGEHSDVEYIYNQTDLEKANGNMKQREYDRLVYGDYQTVKNRIIEISEKFGIEEFLIHTDQEDISNILKLIKDFNTI
jgi:alkanesulfonate monooxygenase SsuD/methylene tetrahydromethanopterin reductase-like flavin-dependent oxidoreductase (luciferase family)